MAFDSVSALQAKLKADIQSAMTGEMSKISEQELKKKVQSNVYSAYSPSAYGRTGQLLNAPTAKDHATGYTHSTFNLTIDDSKISASAVQGGWGIHASVWGTDESSNIGMWTNFGTGGSLWDRPAGHYMEDTLMALEGGKLKNILASHLSGAGWNVS